MDNFVDKAVESFLLDLSEPLKSASRAEELEKKKNQRLAELKAKLTVAPKSDISDSEKRVRDLEAETSISISDSSDVSSSSSSKSSKTEALERKKAELLARKQEISKGKISFVAVTGSSSRIRAIEAEKERYKRELDALPSTTELLAERDTAAKTLNRLERGIGSMASFIATAKDKILEIITKVEKIDPTAIMRVAFVGYRDYEDGDKQSEKVDFVERDQLHVVCNKLADCPATGGGNGLEEYHILVIGLATVLSTTEWQEIHPTGDPKGLIPEDFLRVVIKKRINYYFMKITNHTDMMIGIFQEVFRAAGKEIYINPIAANATDFVPKVLKSISASMARSAAFKGIKVTY